MMNCVYHINFEEQVWKANEIQEDMKPIITRSLHNSFRDNKTSNSAKVDVDNVEALS
jgi:hypothetical protein